MKPTNPVHSLQPSSVRSGLCACVLCCLVFSVLVWSGLVWVCSVYSPVRFGSVRFGLYLWQYIHHVTWRQANGRQRLTDSYHWLIREHFTIKMCILRRDNTRLEVCVCWLCFLWYCPVVRTTLSSSSLIFRSIWFLLVRFSMATWLTTSINCDVPGHKRRRRRRWRW